MHFYFWWVNVLVAVRSTETVEIPSDAGFLNERVCCRWIRHIPLTANTSRIREKLSGTNCFTEVSQRDNLLKHINEHPAIKSEPQI